MKKLIVYTDGGARGNPGPAGIGVHVEDESKNTVAQYKKYLGKKTNNQAEYEAVLLALEKVKEFNPEELDFYLDSLLVVEQLNGKYKVKNQELSKIFVKVWNLKINFKKVTFTHVPREKNKLADKLVNEAIDSALK